MKELIFDFFDENPKGQVHLVYPPQVDYGVSNVRGIELTKDNIRNPNRIRFMETGIYIRQTLGYSLVTGKHLFVPYGSCLLIFLEEGLE